MAPPSDGNNNTTAESSGGAYHKYSSPTNNNSSNNKQGGRSSFTTKQQQQQQRSPMIISSSPTHQTTDLHRACASPSSSPSKLRATLLALGRSSASTKDESGNLPLHILGRNELLIHLFLNKARYDVDGMGSDGIGGGITTTGGGGLNDDDWMSVGDGGIHRGGDTAAATAGPYAMGGTGTTRSPRTELDSFVIELVRAFPRSIITPDMDGRMPLTDAIYDWIDYSTKEHDVLPTAPAAGGGGVGRNVELDRPSILGMGSARGGGGDELDRLGMGGVGGSRLGSDRLEGMSQLMGAQEEDGGHGGRGGGGNDGDDETNVTGRRSIIDNISLPSAFRSAYSASRKVEDGKASRASYRNPYVDGGGGDLNNLDIQKEEFRNVWSATAPRPDGSVSEGGGAASSRAASSRRSGGAGAASRTSSSRRGGGGIASARGGVSDMNSNPPEDGAVDDIFPLNLAMPPIVEWSLRMISVLLDGIDSNDGPLGVDDGDAYGAWKAGNGDDYDPSGAVASGDAAWICNTLVSSIASIPSFMKTLLLLSDYDPVKSRVFHLSIVRRVISSRHAIGNWLVYMLEAVDPIVARRGVDYLEILSEDEDENALIPSTRRVRYAGTQLSPTGRAALYYKVSKLDYFLPAILALEETSEVDRASKTKLLRHILDKELGSRPTLTMAFFDLFFLLLLLVTFQMTVYHVVEQQPKNVKYTTTYFLSMIATLYAILRKFGQMSSMIKISRRAFLENNFRWVDGVDWLAILLVIGGIVWMAVSITDGYQTVPVTDYMRSFLAAGICGVWLKLVSWLSVINWQVINLVGLLSQIVRGIRWILLFLVMTIFASSQMFYVMLSGLSCDENGYYCEKDNAYLKVWAILLGQFDVDDFQTTFSVICFVGFSFVTFIILGYALVATSIDIYNKAVTFRSENSAYGDRSRFVYIAELRAFRRLFDQRWTAMQYCSALLFLTSSFVIFLFAAEEIREALGQFYDGGILGGVVALLILFLFVSITAFVSHMTYYSFVEESGATGCASVVCRILASNFIVRFFSNPIERVMRFIVDIDGIHLDGTPSTAKYTDSWQGSATHVRCHIKRMLMHSEANMSSRLRNDLLVMELRNKKANESNRSDILMEIRASEERMERIMSEFQGWMERKLSSKH